MMQYMFDGKTRFVCDRCGFDWVVDNRESYRQAGKILLCKSCKPGRSETIEKNGLVCRPWAGDVDLDTLQPLDKNGDPYLPGIRLCGNLDCVTRAHVLTVADLLAEQHDISYRTKLKLNSAQFFMQLEREKA